MNDQPVNDATSAPQPSPPPGWLGEGQFVELLAATRARGGMLVARDGVVFSGGGLTEAVAHELEKTAQRSLERLTGEGEHTDLVRFVRLPGQGKWRDHLFYVTSVAPEVVLAMAYAVGTPLRQVREQSAFVAGRLAACMDAPLPPSATEILPTPPSSEPAVEPDAVLPVGDEEEVAEIDLSALLGDVPPPDPYPPGEMLPPSPEISMSLPRLEEEKAPEETPESQGEESPAWAEVLEALSWIEEARNAGNARPQPPAPPEEMPLSEPSPEAEATRPASVESDTMEETLPTPATPVSAPLQLEEPPPDDLEDTRPHVLTHLVSLQQVEPVSAAFSQLSYTCVLIPRLPQHTLTGQLGEQLSQWIQQLCLAFGWRLEGIAVRPQYLQCTVQVSPSIAPAHLVRVLRHRLSELIFQHFPMFGRQNPSGDFWATGYLIVGGPQPPSPRLLRDYIAETRRRQGVTPSGEPLALQQPSSADSASPLH